MGRRKSSVEPCAYHGCKKIHVHIPTNPETHILAEAVKSIEREKENSGWLSNLADLTETNHLPNSGVYTRVKTIIVAYRKLYEARERFVQSTQGMTDGRRQ